MTTRKIETIEITESGRHADDILYAGTYRVEMPADYDPALVTAVDILADDQLVVIDETTMRTPTMTQAIMVQRSDTGTYQIPSAAAAEDWYLVQAEMAEAEHYGDLKGWGEWTAVYRCIDDSGYDRWYFVADVHA